MTELAAMHLLGKNSLDILLRTKGLAYMSVGLGMYLMGY